MDYLSNTTTTSLPGPVGPDSSTAPALAAIFDVKNIQSPFTVGVTTILAALFAFLVNALWRPKVHPQSPEFTKDSSPFIGSFGFIVRGWSFWQGAILESQTGNFSFWLGKRHVVGISGPAARRIFYDNPDMELVSGATLVPFGPHFMPPVHVIFKPSPQLGRNTSWMLHRLKASLKTDALERRLPSLLSDTRKDFAALTANNPSGVTYCPGIWKLVLKHNTRLMFTDDMVDNSKQWDRWVGLMDTALHTASIFNVAFPWLPAPEYIKRRLMRWGLQRITSEQIDKRMLPDAERKDDPLQMLVDNTDRKEFMVEYFFSTVFISSANTHAVAAQLLNIMAIHTEWQDKIFAEVKEAARTHSRRKHASLVEQLDMMPLSAWESSFPSMDLCMKEVVRMWLSISAARRNIGKDPIPIPGSNEVIPPNTFAIYNTTEVHFSDKLYPNPTKFDPTRHLEGREEYKQEMYGYLGWGQGQKICPGQRWAKLQMAMIVAYALATYKWSPCFEDGRPDTQAKHRKMLDTANPLSLPASYCKLEPREVL